MGGEIGNWTSIGLVIIVFIYSTMDTFNYWSFFF